MASHSCVVRITSRFGPTCCGRHATIYDRARKGWLCPEHHRERLCEFCQAERAWVRVCYRLHEVLCEAWLCGDCAPVQSHPPLI